MNLITDVAARPNQGGNQLVVSSVQVVGGTIYTTSVMNNGVIASTSSCFVPFGASPPQRYMNLIEGVSDAGVAITATAGAGAFGISRTPGTSLQLAGEATSASAKTNKVAFEFNLPDTYIAGNDIPVTVNCIVTGAGTLTTASTSMAIAAYSETNGVEAALPVSGSQLFDKTGETLKFTITGTGLVPGQHVMLELVQVVTTSAGACTGFINSVSLQA